MKGRLITFEGIEGCGKSTQAEKLKDYLEAKGYPCVLSREPGGTPLGIKLRQILLHEPMSPLAELLIFLADRNEHINKVIYPSLKQGKTVILDRYYHSTYAYQTGGRGLNFDQVKRLNEMAIEGMYPNLTFFIDIPVEEGFKRKKKAGMISDRIEREDREFHERIRKAFISYTETESNFIRIDGMRSVEEIHMKIVSEMGRLD